MSRPMSATESERRLDRRAVLAVRARLLGAGALAAGGRVVLGWRERAGDHTPGGPSGPPGRGTTGVPAGTALRQSGPVVVTTAGAVVEDLEIDGPVEIRAPRVTVRRCL